MVPIAETTTCQTKFPSSRCDYCGFEGKLNPWNWEGKPDGIWLHEVCEWKWWVKHNVGF